MSRQIICYEGVEKVSGQLIEVGALKWEEGKDYPVVWAFNFAGPPIGNARDIRREEDGSVTADVDIHDERMTQNDLLQDFAVTISGSNTEVKIDQERNLNTFSSVKLRGLSLVIHGLHGVPWKWKMEG
jgi:hypothetical protein